MNTSVNKRWDYRVMQYKPVHKDDPKYGIHEVHYGSDGTCVGATQDCLVVGDNYDEMRTELRHMEDSMNKPILDFYTGKEIDG